MRGHRSLDKDQVKGEGIIGQGTIVRKSEAKGEKSVRWTKVKSKESK